MSEQGFRKYGPGDEIVVLVKIQHVPQYLTEVSARFVPEGQSFEDARYVVGMTGLPQASEADRPWGMLPGEKLSEVRMSATVEPGHPPGVYRLNGVTVTTYGGKEHRYSADDLQGAEVPGFEIVEEPDDKPVIGLSIVG